MLDEALALFNGSLPRGRMGYLVALADVLAQPGKQRDLDAAAARGMEVIQLVDTLDSTRSISLIHDLCQQLPRYLLDQPRMGLQATGHGMTCCPCCP